LVLLKELGYHIPLNPSEDECATLLFEVMELLDLKLGSDLFNITCSSDKKVWLASHINKTLGMTAQSFSTPLFTHLRLTCLKAYLVEGVPNVELFALGLMAYSVVLISAFNDIENGCRYGDIAYDLLKKNNLNTSKPAFATGYAYFCLHWRQPFEEIIPWFEEGARLGVEYGEYFEAAVCLRMKHEFQSYSSMVCSKRLRSIKNDIISATNLKINAVVFTLKISQCLIESQIARSVDCHEVVTAMDQIAFNSTINFNEDVTSSFSLFATKLRLYLDCNCYHEAAVLFP